MMYRKPLIRRVDSNVIKTEENKSSIKIMKVKDLRGKTNFSRGGVIVYTKNEKGILFCMGISAGHYNITDFGGMRKDKDKDIINTSLREFTEESLCIFDDILTDPLIDNSAVIVADDIVIIFVHLIYDVFKAINLFDFNQKNVLKPEIVRLVFMTDEELKKCLNSDMPEPLYFRLFDILKNAKQFYDYL